MTVHLQDTRICNLTLFIVEPRSVLLTQKTPLLRASHAAPAGIRPNWFVSVTSFAETRPSSLLGLAHHGLDLGLSSLRTTRPGFTGGSSPEVGIIPGPGGVNVTGTTYGRILCECATAIYSVGLDRMVFMTSELQDTRSVRVFMHAATSAD